MTFQINIDRYITFFIKQSILLLKTDNVIVTLIVVSFVLVFSSENNARKTKQK